MWGNKIKKLPSGFFKSCTNLRELLLWGNLLEEINENTFAGLWGLRKLDLDKNKISLLHKDAFRHLSNLEVIHLGENEIKTISSETFLFVGNLKVLNLDGNRIEHVYGKAFDGAHQPGHSHPRPQQYQFPSRRSFHEPPKSDDDPAAQEPTRGCLAKDFRQPEVSLPAKPVRQPPGQPAGWHPQAEPSLEELLRRQQQTADGPTMHPV